MAPKGASLSPNNLSGSLGIVHMVSPGIYPSIGYTLNSSQQVFSRQGVSFPLQQSHTLDASVLFDKQILKLLNGRRVLGGCHYLSLGLILAPEYHYMFGNSNLKNSSYGEFATSIGLSFYHFQKSMRKKVKANTRQYDIFFRKGFTPILSVSDNGTETNYFRQEIGLRVRFIRHQVTNFLR
jgi:hypothetical protein